jgi:hypothetical protein
MGAGAMIHASWWHWVDQEAALIKTDGCSWALGFYRRHCKVHDVAYYHGVDPVDAFLLWRLGRHDYWGEARRITQREADEHLRRGIRSDSPLGYLDPIAATRWAVLRAVGGRAWNKHRAREREKELV